MQPTEEFKKEYVDHYGKGDDESLPRFRETWKWYEKGICCGLRIHANTVERNQKFKRNIDEAI